MINDYIRSTMTVEEMVEAFRCWEQGEEWTPSPERRAAAGLRLSKEVEQRRPARVRPKGAWEDLRRKPDPGVPTLISSLDGKAYTAEDIRNMTNEDYLRRRTGLLSRQPANVSYGRMHIPPSEWDPKITYAVASIPSDDWACSDCKRHVTTVTGRKWPVSPLG
jgi:hypothetical protein